MTALIVLTTIVGVATYAAALPCGGLFAATAALLAASVFPVGALA